MLTTFAHAVAAIVALAAPPTPVPADFAAKVDSLVDRAMLHPTAVGFSVAVAKDGEVILSKGYGKADLEFAVPVDKDTMFRIGSVTKQFTAAAIMKLVEQGKLSLDDTLAKMLPDFPATPKPVTLRQLLTHTSGIWSYTSSEKFMMRDAALELTPAELIATFKDHAPDFEPGSSWSYSNSGYYLLGEIVARASGKPYAVFVQDELFTPLGLTRTRYESNREVIPNRAQGYSMVKGKLSNDLPIGADVPGAAGSLLSSAEGLVRWNTALVNGKVVTPESYTQMTTPVEVTDGNKSKRRDYGFGLALDSFEDRSRVQHGGGIFGFKSMLVYLPAEELAVAVIANCDAADVGKLTDAIARAALGIKEFVPQDLKVSAEDAKYFVGEYKFEEIPLSVVFRERNGKLYAQATGQPEGGLLYQGKGVFAAEFDHQVKFTFPFPQAEGGTPDGPAEKVTLLQGRELVARRVVGKSE